MNTDEGLPILLSQTFCLHCCRSSQALIPRFGSLTQMANRFREEGPAILPYQKARYTRRSSTSLQASRSRLLSVPTEPWRPARTPATGFQTMDATRARSNLRRIRALCITSGRIQPRLSLDRGLSPASWRWHATGDAAPANDTGLPLAWISRCQECCYTGTPRSHRRI